jgi:hypothetical protein
MTESASCRMALRVPGSSQQRRLALEMSDQGGQDKNRKVRTVGWVGNSTKSGLLANIASVSRNLRFSATHYGSSTFYALRGE